MSDNSKKSTQDIDTNKTPESTSAILPEKNAEQSDLKSAEEEAAAKVVKSIEDDVAAHAEKDQEEKESIPAADFQSMDMEQLVKELEDLIKNQKVQSVKSNVENIKKIFDSKFGALLAEKKAAFLAEGGESIDFHYARPVKVAFNGLMSQYKTLRNKHYAELENQLKTQTLSSLQCLQLLHQLVLN